MNLLGQQRKRLQEALITAFPTKASLEQMLSFELDKNLRTIAGEGSLQDIVFRLIQVAEAEGWVRDLVRAARNSNRGNPLLIVIAEELLTGERPQAFSLNVPQQPSRFVSIAKPRSTQQQKILVSGASVVIIFILIAGGATFLNFVTEKQPTFPPSPTNSTSPSKPEQPTSTQLADDLSSDRDVDYTRLRNLLAVRNWKDADYETYLVMLKVVGRKENDSIRNEELLNFLCTDLRTIDRLWVKYSDRRFGISVQKKIYLEVGGVPNGQFHQEAWEKFGDRVGWRVNQTWIDYSQVTFDTTAPEGHLPRVIFFQPNLSMQFSSLALRLVNCNL